MFRWIFLSFFFFSSSSVFSSISVVGNFQAQDSCEAYISKNKQSNPDGSHVIPKTQYKIIEINRPQNPDWLRIEIPTSNYPIRWVNARCGTFNYDVNGKSNCEQIPGLADSYVLALSWQPGFCQTYGYEMNKPECTHLNKSSYSASHLVLHGLWPNQQICGQHYGYCGTKPQKNHCDYQPLNLSEGVAVSLRQFMPSFAYGSCLERHEWNRHGSCQILTSDQYFSLAIRLNQEANATQLGEYLHDHVGDFISKSQIQTAVLSSFGNNAIKKIYLGCKNGVLVDIYIQLPALIPQTESLTSLVNKAPDFMAHDSCPNQIFISDFNKSSWF